MKVLSHSRGHSRAALLAAAFAILLAAPLAMAQAGGSDAPATSDKPPDKAADKSDKPSDKPGDKSPGKAADPAAAKDGAQTDSTAEPMTKLRILITGNTDKPIGNASVYVRYNTAGGFLHHDKLAEMDLKTNQDGSVKVPAISPGRVMIQVYAPGWHTYGKWYDLDKGEQVISIKLEAPPHWY